MKIQPLSDRIVITKIKEEVKNYGGIILPDSVSEKPQMAEVIAVGTDEDLLDLIKIGNKVLYNKYGGTDIEFDNEKYIIISINDILAIITE